MFLPILTGALVLAVLFCFVGAALGFSQLQKAHDRGMSCFCTGIVLILITLGMVLGHVTTAHADTLPGQWRLSTALHSANLIRKAGTGDALLLRCNKGQWQVIVLNGAVVDIPLQTYVTLQMDDGFPEADAWVVASSHQALFAPKPNTLISHLMAARQLRFKYEDVTDQPHPFVIDLTGLPALMQHAGRACGSP